MSHRQWNEANSLSNKCKNDAYINYQKKHEQMSKQEMIIEQKKQEILKKQEAKKKKETEEALKKLNEDKHKNESRQKRGYYAYTKSKNWPVRERPEVTAPPPLPANIFTNDGSFFEQFQKISGVKVDVKKRTDRSSKASDKNNGDSGNDGIQQFTGTGNRGPEGGQREQRWSGREIQTQFLQQSQIPQQMPQHMMLPQIMPQQQPLLQQQVFTPQMHRPVPPPMAMNYPPQFNPLQCGNMMMPPPVPPASIPPPGPMNPCSIPSPSPLQPCSIPSPSPLQPCSIPSPSPLQPYAIPPPSPLIPHSIPPPSPMVPHSIPPPSPLTPHSIPPPQPLRPQSIPPPVQRAPLFLTMVPPPPPPPPPEEEKQKVKPVESLNSVVVNNDDNNDYVDRDEKEDDETEIKLVENVKDLFNKDDYSSSSSSSSEEDEEERGRRFGPSNRKHSSSSDSESEPEPERRSPESNSDKESDVDSDPKEDTLSEMDSILEQDSQPMHDTGLDSVAITPRTPIVIEDTATQFPSDTKDSSNTGDGAPPDLCSDNDSQTSPQGDTEGIVPGPVTEPNSPMEDAEQQCSSFEKEVKKEAEENEENFYEIKYVEDVKPKEEEIERVVTYCEEETKQEMKPDIKDDIFLDVKPSLYEVKEEFIKQEFVSEISPEAMTIKSDEPPVKKKRKSRWGATEEEKVDIPSIVAPMPPMPPQPPSLPPGVVAPIALGRVNTIVPPVPQPSVPNMDNVPGMSGPMISKVSRSDSGLTAYAMKAYGRTNLTDAEWKTAEDHYKINLLYQDMIRKRDELQMLQAKGKNRYEYDSDEDIDESGTWEHKLRSAEMEATRLWADELTEQAKGKHHIGDFLPPDELARFLEKYKALKEGREPDLSDYKEFKLKEDNIGFQMLQKLGWTEGQGLGPDGSGIMDPVNKSTVRPENQGLGVDRPDDLEVDDDEYDAYRKRMMLAYRFRPNPMNNPRRSYY